MKWAEGGDASTKYFFRLGKKRGADQWCSARRKEEGSIALSINDIRATWSLFYSSLFFAKPTDPEKQDDLLQRYESTLRWPVNGG